jgi:fibronectin type 3 domain-containing protein
LEWYSTSASGNTQSYNIYRSTSSNGTYLFIKNVLPTSSPESTIDIPSPGTYYYRITVVTTNGEEGVPCDFRLQQDLSL